MDYNVNPSVNFEITTNSTNFDVFKETKVSAYILKFGYTADKLLASGCKMKLSFLPTSACNVVVNGNDSSAKEFYSTGGYTNINSLIIKETGISGTLIIAIA